MRSLGEREHGPEPRPGDYQHEEAQSRRCDHGGETPKSELSREPRVRLKEASSRQLCLILSRVKCSIVKKSLETKNSFSVMLEMEA